MENIKLSDENLTKIATWQKEAEEKSANPFRMNEGTLKIQDSEAVVISGRYLKALLDTCELVADPDRAKELLRLKNAPSSEFESLNE